MNIKRVGEKKNSPLATSAAVGKSVGSMSGRMIAAGGGLMLPHTGLFEVGSFCCDDSWTIAARGCGWITFPT